MRRSDDLVMSRIIIHTKASDTILSITDSTMTIPDARVRAYATLFKSEIAAPLIAVFHAVARYKRGRWFGDFFRGLVQRIIPIALNVCTSALSPMRDAHEQGASFKDSLISPVRPATKAAIHGAHSPIDKAQHGTGHNRGRKHKTVYKGHIGKRS